MFRRLSGVDRSNSCESVLEMKCMTGILVSLGHLILVGLLLRWFDVSSRYLRSDSQTTAQFVVRSRRQRRAAATRVRLSRDTTLPCLPTRRLPRVPCQV